MRRDVRRRHLRRIAYTLEEHFAESLVVIAVLAVGGVLYRVFGRAPRRSTAATPDALPEVRVVGDPPG